MNEGLIEFLNEQKEKDTLEIDSFKKIIESIDRSMDQLAKQKLETEVNILEYENGNNKRNQIITILEKV